MTDKQKLALAMLRSGSSYADAMRQTGLTLEQVQALWKEHGHAKAN
jgi:hypothetical protein